MGWCSDNIIIYPPDQRNLDTRCMHTMAEQSRLKDRAHLNQFIVLVPPFSYIEESKSLVNMYLLFPTLPCSGMKVECSTFLNRFPYACFCFPAHVSYNIWQCWWGLEGAYGHSNLYFHFINPSCTHIHITHGCKAKKIILLLRSSQTPPPSIFFLTEMSSLTTYSAVKGINLGRFSWCVQGTVKKVFEGRSGGNFFLFFAFNIIIWE